MYICPLFIWNVAVKHHDNDAGRTRTAHNSDGAGTCPFAAASGATSQTEMPEQRGVQLLHEAQRNQAAISTAIAKAFAEMGITGEPIGAELVQEMIRACGMQPDDNTFSQGIIAMREE